MFIASYYMNFFLLLFSYVFHLYYPIHLTHLSLFIVHIKSYMYMNFAYEISILLLHAYFHVYDSIHYNIRTFWSIMHAHIHTHIYFLDACERLTSIADLAKAAGVGHGSYWFPSSVTFQHSSSTIKSNHRNNLNNSSNNYKYNHPVISSTSSCSESGHSSSCHDGKQITDYLISNTTTKNSIIKSSESSLSSSSRLKTVHKRSRNDTHNLYQLMMNGPGQDNAFYLVMPSTKPNPANHNNCSYDNNNTTNSHTLGKKHQSLHTRK